MLADGIVVRDNTAVGGGRGLFATAPIPAGGAVWREDPGSEPHFTSTPRPLAWVQALPPGAQAAYRHFMYKTGEVRSGAARGRRTSPFLAHPSAR